MSTLITEDLIKKYSGSGPRYTSYPTAVEFNSAFGAKEWQQALAEDDIRSKKPSVALYFHLPFCHSLCYFCACNKIITEDKSVVRPYLNALLAELKIYQKLVGSDVALEQIHWGGGTPNFFSADEMQELHLGTLEAFPNLLPDAEVALEVDPRTVVEAQLKTLKKLGFSRISMGVQDFNPHVQEVINRIQPYEMTLDLCNLARDLGFSGINIDLIYGLPDQTLDGFKNTIDKVLAIRPDRVALYGYAHVTWIKKVQKAFERTHLPTPNERITVFSEAVKMFQDAGYLHIGLDHFALPTDSLSQALKNGKLNRNFMGYSEHRGARVIGLGVSAISSLPRAFAQNTKDIYQYQEKISKGELVIERGLLKSDDDCRRGEIIERILCQGGIDIQEFEAEWAIDFNYEYRDSLFELEKLVSDGLLQIKKEKILVTETGRYFARNIAMPFDAYLKKHQELKKPIFSQAV